MADSHFPQNPQFQANPNTKGKPFSSFLFKFLLISLFISVIPLFPTDPPKFIKGTIFGPTWGLIHLLVIGIVVSYGFFCRLKISQVPPKPHSENPFVNTAIPTQSFNFSYYRNEPFGERPLGLPVRSLRSSVCSDISDSECESPVGKDRNLERNVGGLSPIPWDSRPMGVDFIGEDSNYEVNQLNSQSFRSPIEGLHQKNRGFGCSWLPESPNIEQHPVRVPPMVGSSWTNETFEMPVSGFSTQVYDTNVFGMPPNLGEGNFGWEENKFYMHSTEAINDYGSMYSMYSHERVNLGEPSIFENVNSGSDVTGFFTPPSFSGPERNLASPVRTSRSRKCSNVDGDLGNFEHENLGSSEKNSLFMPSVTNAPSISVPDSDFTSYAKSSVKPSRSRKPGHENGDLGKSPNFEIGNLGSSEKNNMFMPSTAYAPSVSVPDNDFTSSARSSVKPSRSRKFVHKNEDLGKSPNIGNLGSSEKNGLFMPSTANAPSVIVADSDFTSSVCTSVKPLRSRKSGHENGNLGKSANFEIGNLGSSEKNSLFMPSTANAPSVIVADNDFTSSACTSVKPLRSRKSGHENGNLGKSPNFEIGNLGSSEKNSLFMPSTANAPSVIVADNDFTSSACTSVKPLRSRKSGHENEDSGMSPNFEAGNLGSSEKNSLVMPSVANAPSVSVTDSDFTPLRSRKIGHENEDLGKSPENGKLGGEKTSSFKPSSTVHPSSNSAHRKGLATSVRRSRSKKLFEEDGESGKSTNLESVNMGTEKANSFMPPSTVDPSSNSVQGKGLAFSVRRSRSRKFVLENGGLGESTNLEDVNLANSFMPSSSDAPSININKDGERLKGDNVSPDGFDSLVDGPSLNIDEKKSMPTSWNDDCFVIPSTENVDLRNVEQENVPCSLEPPSTAVSSSKRLSTELELPKSKEVGTVLASSLPSNLEIEELGEENDNYKPSTPSPPARNQTRRNDHFPSSVESSCNTLAIGSFHDDGDGDGDGDDNEVGSPPTPEKGKTLLRTSRSRRFGCVAFFDKDQRKKGSKGDHTKEANRKISGGKLCGWDCLKLDLKPSLNKPALKGKSVRTIMPRETPQEEEMVIIKIGISERKSYSSSNSGSNDQKQGNETTSIIVGLNSKESCKDKIVDTKEEEMTDSEEIDRKAAEFIAKFKEQIRLQKVSSRQKHPQRIH